MLFVDNFLRNMLHSVNFAIIILEYQKISYTNKSNMSLTISLNFSEAKCQ